MAIKHNRLGGGIIYTDAASFAAYNSSTLPYPGALGSVYEKDGNKYQLVKLDSSAVTAAAGHAVAWIDFDDFVVTNDISDSSVNFPAGVLLTAATAGNYCYIQIRGTYASVKTDAGDDIALGDGLVLDPTTDGSVDSVTAAATGVNVLLGVAIAADVDTLDTVAVAITCPLNGV